MPTRPSWGFWREMRWMVLLYPSRKWFSCEQLRTAPGEAPLGLARWGRCSDKAMAAYLPGVLAIESVLPIFPFPYIFPSIFPYTPVALGGCWW